MLAVHVWYGLGIVVLSLTAMSSYHLLQTTYLGQRLEDSIIYINDSKYFQDDSFVYRYTGEDVSFDCNLKLASGGEETKRSIRWTVNGRLITDDSRHFRNVKKGEPSDISDDFVQSILQIYNLQEGDFGVYECSFDQCKDDRTAKLTDPSSLLHGRQSTCSSKQRNGFKLKQFTARTDTIFIAPGGILRLQLKFHFYPQNDSDVSIIYTINNKPIVIKDDRQLFTKCSFFIYNYWLLFEHGNLLSQLNTSNVVADDTHILEADTNNTKVVAEDTQVLEADTNFCINDDFFGTYRFFIQKRYFDQKRNRRKLSDINYPVTFQVLPRRPDLFDSEYFTVIPSKVLVTNTTRQCWVDSSYQFDNFCADFLESFKSIPALFFTIEGLVFFVCFGVCYQCFRFYIHILNLGFLYVVRDGLQLDHYFQVIRRVGNRVAIENQSRNDIANTPSSIMPQGQGLGFDNGISTVNRQIYIAYADADKKAGEAIKTELENILRSKNLTTVSIVTKDNVMANCSIIQGEDQLISTSDGFLVYATSNYCENCETEIAKITYTVSSKKRADLIVLEVCRPMPNIFGVPRMTLHWHDGMTQTARRIKLDEWLNGVIKSED